MDNLVSVIIPIYNVEKYLSECLNSVIQQTYKNLEIILIDDGSTDSSSDIAKEFVLQDKRIKLFTQENGGQSKARNFGIQQAQGDFLIFVDSDDYIQNFHIEELMDVIKENEHLKVVMCKFTKETTDLTAKKSNDYSIFSNSFVKMINYLYKSSYPAMSPTCKLYCRELFKEVYFHEGIIYEDGLFAYEILDQITEIGLLNSKSYYYRTAENSTLTSKISVKNFDVLKKNELLKEFFIKKYPEEMDHFYQKALNLNDSIAVKCIQDRGDLAKSLLKKIYSQNKLYSKNNFPRKLLYSNSLFYKTFLYAMSTIYSESKTGEDTMLKKIIGKVVK